MSMQDNAADHDAAGHTEAGFPGPETLCAEVEAYIAEKPFRSLAMALLAGIIVGKIIL